MTRSGCCTVFGICGHLELGEDEATLLSAGVGVRWEALRSGFGRLYSINAGVDMIGFFLL